MQPANPVPRPKGHVVEVLDSNAVILGNAVWYGTPTVRIPIFGTGIMHTFSINHVDQELPDEQRLAVEPNQLVTFDVHPPKPTEPAQAAAPGESGEVLPPAAA